MSVGRTYDTINLIDFATIQKNRKLQYFLCYRKGISGFIHQQETKKTLSVNV